MSSNKIIPSLLAAAAIAQAATTTTHPIAGYTLSNGGYVCNPAHSYPGATCDGSQPTPTLSYYPSSTPVTTTHPIAGYTLSNGGYVCNPAHSYPGATCDGSQATPTLSYYPTTVAAPSAGQTLSNGGYVCNPAHSYPGATCDGSQPTPTLSYYPTSSQKTTLVTSVRTTTPAAPATATVTVSACPSTALTVKSTAAAAPPASSSTCPLTLSGKTFEYPHLIVASTSGANTGSTLYTPTINPSTTAYFNFDIPQSLSGKTCDVVFSLPLASQLQTSSFTLSGDGALVFSSLKSAAVENGAVPATSAKLSTWSSVAPGQQFAVASGPCAAGQRIGYSIAAEGSRALTYFQDYNPCPIGLYVIAH